MQKNITAEKDKDLLECKICGKKFSSIRGKHLHISKTHKTSLSKYYKEYYPRKTKLYSKSIKFKNVNQYFSDDFSNRNELIEWCDKENKETVSKYIKDLLLDRIKNKGIKYSLSEVELELCDFPGINYYKKIFGNYSNLCSQIGLKNVFNKNLPNGFFQKNSDNITIFVDTREQKPISFVNQEFMKLDFGDYTCSSPHYDYTYVDRKSEGDFKSTMSGDNFERFKRELDRARSFDSYVFVVVESSIEKINKNNLFTPYKSKLPYIWHNVKQISQEYKDCCQFVFAGNRNGLKKIIPNLLLHGKQLWNVDIQYFLNERIRRKREDSLVA